MRGRWTVFVVLAGLFAWPAEGPAQDQKVLERGKAVYASRCVICYGDQGDGKGLIGIVHRAQTNGVVQTIYPRDFTAGDFKFRSTPSGYLPTDEDLMRTITDGISRAGMPSHTDLSEADGSFSIPNVPSGEREVWVWHAGEAHKWKSVNVKASGPTEISIEVGNP